MKVNREELLSRLKAISIGLEKREVVEQSDCFVFAKDKVMVYNGEVFSSAKLSMGIEGVIKAKTLLDLLNKLTANDLEVEQDDQSLLVKDGGKRRAMIRMQEGESLPIDEISIPSTWNELPKGFVEAVKTASSCVSKDASNPVLTKVHFHPDWIEACDDFQLFRYPMDGKWVDAPFLIGGLQIKKIVGIELNGFAKEENWMHFDVGDGVVCSCRRYTYTFPVLTEHFEVKGKVIKFPEKISAAIDRARIFSAEEGMDENVQVSFRSGEMQIRGEGPTGWYCERAKVDFSERLSFRVAPRLLDDMMRRGGVCTVSDKFLKLNTDEYEFACLLEV